jgi:hypothetical protein
MTPPVTPPVTSPNAARPLALFRCTQMVLYPKA